MTQQPGSWPHADPSGSAAPASAGSGHPPYLRPAQLSAAAAPAVVAAPPPSGRWQAARVEPVPGTRFGIVHLQVSPVTSGLAVGSMAAGIAAILVAFLVLCFGLVGSGSTWGPWVAGAFAVLGGLAGAAGIGLGLTARRQIRRSGQSGQVRFTGRGVAMTGIACGGTGLGISALSLALAVVLHLR